MSEDCRCPVCTTTSENIVVDMGDCQVFYAGEFRDVGIKKAFCESCNLIFAVKLPQAYDVSQYYHERPVLEKSSTNVAYAKEVDKNSPMVIEYIARAKYLEKQFIENCNLNGGARKVLDIGCSNGEFLMPFLEVGWQPYGVEPGATAEIAASRGIETYRGLFDSSIFESSQFNLVTMMHVLEHTEAPGKVLSQINEILCDDGLLYIEVPDTLSIMSGKSSPERKHFWDLYNSEHLLHFSFFSLAKLLKDSGFRILDMSRIHYNVNAEWDEIGILAQKAPGSEQVDSDRLITLRQAKFNFEAIQKFSAFKNSSQKNLEEKIAGKKVAVYCAGWHTTCVLPGFFGFQLDSPEAYIDKDEAKQNKSLLTYKIVSPKDIPTLDVDAILISSSDWEDEIYTELRSHVASGIEVIKIYSE